MARSIEEHDEHCKGWRWYFYVQNVSKRMDFNKQRQDNLTSQQRADIELAYWQALRVRA